MLDLISQLNPVTLMIVIALIVLNVAGALILRLVRQGAAKPADIVNATKARIEQGKARKEAVKQAEAAIAEPVANSRLSRIGARGGASEPAGIELAEAVGETDAPPAATAAIDAADYGHDEASDVPYEPEFEAEAADGADPLLFEDVETSAVFAAEIVGEADDEDAVCPAPESWHGSEAVSDDMPFDFADPVNHPRNWTELVAVIDALDQVLTRPWAEDRMTLQLSRDQLAASAAGDEAATLNLSKQLAATDLARTINSAAREQAAEVVAVVREFAHRAPFDSDECAAVMNGLTEIEWMALNRNGQELGKRTLPLTVSAPETPLWVEDAQAAVERLRRDLAA